MSRSPAALPDPLQARPFSVADGSAFGLTDRRMRAKDLAAPFHGIRTPASMTDVTTRCVARMTRLPPYAAVSHATAALLDGLPLPTRLEHDETVHISVPLGARAPRGRGTCGHQVRCGPADADHRHGFLSTAAHRTFCDLAATLSLHELVAVGDHILHNRLATRAELADAVSRHASARGRPRLLLALELLDERAESPKESELRVLLHDRDLPKPDVNHVVRDERRRFVARVDMAYAHARIAIEYEGDHHRDPAQWRRDLARRRRLEALGWIYLTVTQADLDDPTDFLSDLRVALQRRTITD